MVEVYFPGHFWFNSKIHLNRNSDMREAVLEHNGQPVMRVDHRQRLSKYSEPGAEDEKEKVSIRLRGSHGLSVGLPQRGRSATTRLEWRGQAALGSRRSATRGRTKIASRPVSSRPTPL